MNTDQQCCYCWTYPELLILWIMGYFSIALPRVLASKTEPSPGLHPTFKSDISLSLLTVSILVNVNCYMVYHKVLSWGPILYSMYTYLHGNIVRRYDMSLHFYLSFESTVPSVLIASKIEACIMDIDKWMAANKLMLNTDKMELLLSGSQFGSQPRISDVRVGNDLIPSSESARNIIVIFGSNMDYKRHISAI